MTHTRSHKLFATVALTVLSWTSTLLLTTPATAETPTDAEIAPLIEQLKVADEFNRGDTVAALAEVGASAIPALIKALESDNFLIRQGAVEALSRIGEPAVPHLLKAVESDSPRVRGITATVFGNMNPLNLDSVGPVGPVLLQLLLQDPDPRVRRSAAASFSWLIKFRDIPAVEGLSQLIKDSVPELIASLKNDPDGQVRSSASEALGWIGADAKAAVPDLINALKNDSDSDVRSSAARALGRIGADAKAAVPDLVNALRNDSDSDVRSSASEALGWIGADAKAAVPDLIRDFHKIKSANFTGHYRRCLQTIFPRCTDYLALCLSNE